MINYQFFSKSQKLPEHLLNVVNIFKNHENTIESKPRVFFHEPAKWVAKLRHLNTTTQPLLLQCQMGTGHAGKTDRYEHWREEAKKLNFVISTLSVD